MGITKFRTI